MADYRTQAAAQQELQRLADLEDTYLKAKDAYREKDTPARREKFQAAKQEFADARQSHRQSEEVAGRRAFGASVNGGQQ